MSVVTRENTVGSEIGVCCDGKEMSVVKGKDTSCDRKESLL